MKITKALIMAAGYGTRRLPITKAIDKCMLPIGNRPLIDYVVEDCINAGITDIYIAIGKQGSQLRNYYSPDPEFEEYLKSKGKLEQLTEIQAIHTRANFHFFDCPARGTSSPGYYFMQKFGQLNDDERLVVVGGDDFIYQPRGGSAIKQLIDGVEAAGATAGMLSITVPHKTVHKYGVLKMDNGNFVSIVEKPAIQDAPSNQVNISKYVFDAEMLRNVAWTMEHPNPVRGESELTDALNRYVAGGKALRVVTAEGEFLDGGSLEGWLYANQRVIGT